MVYLQIRPISTIVPVFLWITPLQMDWIINRVTELFRLQPVKPCSLVLHFHSITEFIFPHEHSPIVKKKFYDLSDSIYKLLDYRKFSFISISTFNKFDFSFCFRVEKQLMYWSMKVVLCLNMSKPPISENSSWQENGPKFEKPQQIWLRLSWILYFLGINCTGQTQTIYRRKRRNTG